MKIKFNDLGSQWGEIKEVTLPKITTCLETGNFILGKEVEIFEQNFAKWNGNKFAIGVANGTDALKISIESLGLKGKSIFYIPANTFIATALSPYISFTKNFEIKLIDCDESCQIDYNLLEVEVKNDFNKYDNQIIIAVHLFGSSCDIEKIQILSKNFNCILIEDCSQSHGALTDSKKKVGTFGKVSAFSCYPGKNLGAAGDAGIIVTDDLEIYEKCKYLRNVGSIKKYEHDYKGWNSRLDTIQSIILDEKLKFLDEWNKKRNEIANFYTENIKNNKIKILKKPSYCSYHVYHIFVILTDEQKKLQDYLDKNGIPNLVHYPTPIEKTKAFLPNKFDNKKTKNFSNKMVSIPIHPFITEKEINYIVYKINNF